MFTERLDVSPAKVAVYIRWSTEEQGSGTTMQVQLERCKAFVNGMGWDFRDDLLFIDDGRSGATLDRPGLTRLRAAVDESKVQCVVVYKMDRLSRSVADIANLVTREWEGRCHFQSATESIDTLTPAGKMFFYNLSSFAEYERSLIRERTFGGKVRRAKEGRNPGFRPPFGLRRGATPGSFAVFEEEAAVVRRIYEMYRTGLGSAQIAHMLNREGIGHRGRAWTDLGVRRLLHNPAYKGSLEYGRTSRTPKVHRTRQGVKAEVRHAQPRYAVVPQAIPVIVAESTWNEVQEILRKRSELRIKAGQKPSYSDYLLSGIARCRCGAPLNGNKVRDGHRYYYCSARKRQGPSACDAGHIPVAAADEQIERRLRDLLTIRALEAYLEPVEAKVAEHLALLRTALDTVRLELQSYEEHHRRLQRDYRNGDLSAKRYEQELDDAERDKVELFRRMENLQTQIDVWTGTHSDRATWLQELEAINAWELLSIPERKQLLRKLLVSVVLYRRANGREPIALDMTWVETKSFNLQPAYLPSP